MYRDTKIPLFMLKTKLFLRTFDPNTIFIVILYGVNKNKNHHKHNLKTKKQ